MSEPTRQILMPGAAAPAASPVETPAAAPAAEAASAPQRAKPGPKPRNAQPLTTPAAAPAADDLAEFDTDELPPAPEGGTLRRAQVQALLDAQAAKFQAQIADAIRAAKSSQDPATAAKLAAQRIEGQKLPSVEAAMAMHADAIKNGIRPRAIPTDAGWVVHREMARSKDPMVGAVEG